MHLYSADIAFLPVRPGNASFVVATHRNKSVRVRATKSVDAARSLAEELQHAFQAHALPSDVASRLSDRFQLSNK